MPEARYVALPGGLTEPPLRVDNANANRQASFSEVASIPESGRDYPPNVNISVGGGKETNQDFPSNGE